MKYNVTARQTKRINSRDPFARDDNQLGDLIKAFADLFDGSIERTLVTTVTTAEINAGKVLIPAIDGVSIVPTGYAMVVAGAYATGTNIKLQDEADTPVVVVTALTAALTDGAKIPGDSTVANVTNGAGYLAPLTAGKGLKIVKTGTDFTVGTSIKLVIRYLLA